MKNFLKKYETWLFPGAFLLVLSGLSLVWFGLIREINIVLDSEDRTVRSASFSIESMLRSAGISPDEADRIITDPSQSIWELDTIHVETARKIILKTPNNEQVIETTEDIPANILNSTGIEMYPSDQVLINGEAIDANKPLPGDGTFLLQYNPADNFMLKIDGKELVVYTNEATLGGALEEALIDVSHTDWISQPLSTPVKEVGTVSIHFAKPISVMVNGEAIFGLTSAKTVGEALEDVGLSLQNLDYSIPASEESLPEDGQIKIVRVNEEVLLMTDEVPYENEWVEDPEAMLDTISVVQPGQQGIYASRERIRYENGEEVWRNAQDTWQASQAQDGVLGYGTQVALRKEVVDGQEIEYWRKITVYATSYSPCRSGIDGCSTGTATGILPVQKGVIAVTPRWLSVPNGYGMWGQNVYVLGYGQGVIADVGGGIPGTPWIDLAYSDEGYIPWSRWTTMYFLAPIPPWYPPFILP